MEWAALPLPDVNAQTSDKNNFVVVFDFPTLTYKLKKFTVPYYPDQDALIRYFFVPSSSTTTFTSGALTYIKNSAITGSTYDIGVNSTTKILYGSNITLGAGSSGLNFLKTRGAGWFQMQNGVPTTANHAFVFAFQPDQTNLTGPLTLHRTQPTYTTSSNNTIASQISPNSNPSFAGIIWNGHTAQLNQTVSLTQNGCYILSFIVLNSIMYMYLNGTHLGQRNDYEDYGISDVLSFLNGSDTPGINESYNFYGTMYAVTLMENITSILDVQKFEGYVKWTSPMATLPWVLDGTHPYSHTAPSL
jgi:hypothetical protein